MTSYDNLSNDFYIAFLLVGLGFCFRLGMCGFDAFLELLKVHFQRKRKEP